jgi:hypothetical protein
MPVKAKPAETRTMTIDRSLSCDGMAQIVPSEQVSNQKWSRLQRRSTEITS